MSDISQKQPCLGLQTASRVLGEEIGSISLCCGGHAKTSAVQIRGIGKSVMRAAFSGACGKSRPVVATAGWGAHIISREIWRNLLKPNSHILRQSGKYQCDNNHVERTLTPLI
jgi:hypothetical protein